MPKGIYITIKLKNIENGDIIVFNNKIYNGNLIKYAIVLEQIEYCEDQEGTLWVNSIPQAQKNIVKYPESIPFQSSCRRLKNGELLVFGEHPDSYDSRYFGPIHKNEVIAQVKLLVAF